MVTFLWRNSDVENATISGKLEIGLHYLGVLFPDTFCPTLISFFLNEVAYSAILSLRKVSDSKILVFCDFSLLDVICLLLKFS